MQIVTINASKLVTISNLKIGDWFKFDSRYYLYLGEKGTLTQADNIWVFRIFGEDSTCVELLDAKVHLSRRT